MRLYLALYRLLLRLLPPDLRSAHADRMVEMVEESLAEAGSARARARIWLGAIGDLARRSPYEHWLDRERTQRRQRRMSSLPQDVRYAIRGFGRQPGVAAILLLTLSLGIAAAVAVFSLVNGVILRPLPFPDGDRLVAMNETAPTWNLEYTGINYPDFAKWRENVRTFDGIALVEGYAVNLADEQRADRVFGAAVTFDLASVLRIQPLLGRAFTAEEDRPNGPAVVMIGAELWRDRFGNDPGVIGKTLTMNSRPFTIVGVLPAEAEFPGRYKFWVPLQGDPNLSYQSYSYSGIGRLKPGVSLTEARTDLMGAHQPIWAESDTARVVSPVVESLRGNLVRGFELMTVALGVGVLLVLLCACTNVAGTMLARAIFRQREMAVRMALGADAVRVGGLLVVESVILAAAAGVVGVFLAQIGLRLFLAGLPDQLPAWMQFAPDWRVVLAAIGTVGITALLFGVAPALQARNQDARAVLGGSGLRASLSRAQRRWLDGFVIAEVALATVLLVGSGLLFRAYRSIQHLDPGFRAEGILTLRVAPPAARYPDSTLIPLYNRLGDALRAVPGAARVELVSCPPLDCHLGRFFQAEGQAPIPPGGVNPVIPTFGASPGYFETIGIPLRGRTFTAEDGISGKASTAIVTEAFARLKWPDGQSPIGRQIWFPGGPEQKFTVIGIAADTRQRGLDQSIRPTVYLPIPTLVSFGTRSLAFVIRSPGRPESLMEPVRQAVRAIDPELAVFDQRALTTTLERSLAIRRVLSAVLALFASLALVLAVGGIYAVVSYVVGRRTVELGIRVALGAERRQVIGLVLGQGIRLVFWGLSLGIPLAMVSARLLAAKVEGVRAFDPISLGVAVVILAVTGLGAAFVPARRAARVDPRVSLFAE